MSAHLSWLEAGVVGAMQGVSELFPVSSLGHSVLIPAWVGGSWAHDLNVSDAGVAVPRVHRRPARRHRDRADHLLLARLGPHRRRPGHQHRAGARSHAPISGWPGCWCSRTIPVGLVGLLAEHWFRDHAGQTGADRDLPRWSTGSILLGAEQLRRRDAGRRHASTSTNGSPARSPTSGSRELPVGQAVVHRLGADPRAGARHLPLRHHDGRRHAARAVPRGRRPVLLPARDAGHPRRGRAQARRPGRSARRRHPGPGALRSVLSGVGAYLSVRFLTRYLANRSLRPFGVYCLAGRRREPGRCSRSADPPRPDQIDRGPDDARPRRRRPRRESDTGARILVVEDDDNLRDVIARGLRAEGYVVQTARDGESALRLDLAATDAVVLDIGLPDSDGRDVCQAIRARGSGTPVLLLTARHAVHDRLSGFAVGADDYLPKPFAFAELVARIRVMLRRSGTSTGTRWSDLHVDPVTHSPDQRDHEGRAVPARVPVARSTVGDPGSCGPAAPVGRGRVADRWRGVGQHSGSVRQ